MDYKTKQQKWYHSPLYSSAYIKIRLTIGGKVCHIVFKI